MAAQHSWLWYAVRALVVSILLAATWVVYRTNRTAGAQRKVSNPDGRPVATIAYQPGLSDFPASVAGALGEGFVALGWQVRLVTATNDAIPDATSADLLLLVAPIYWAAPARPMRRFVTALGDLHDCPVVVVLTGAGSEKSAPAILSADVARVHGRVLRSLVYYTMRPNDEKHYQASRNRADALRMAKEAMIALAKEWR